MEQTKLNKTMENVERLIVQEAQFAYFGGDSYEKLEVNYMFNIAMLYIEDSGFKAIFEYELEEDDTEETIIRGLIDQVYKKYLLKYKYKIKGIKKYLKSQFERIFKWEYKLQKVKDSSKPEDLKVKEECMSKLNLINYTIYLKYKTMDSLQCEMYDYENIKNILFQAIKFIEKDQDLPF